MCQLSASLLCLRLRQPPLHLARQVRNNADHAFDQHELAAMMHFVFFYRCDHVEAGSRRWCSACRHGEDLAKKFFGNASNETRPLFTLLPEQFKDLGFRSRLCFLSHYLLHQGWKVEAVQRCPLFDRVNLITESRRQRDMGQKFLDGTDIVGSSETVLAIRNVSGNLNCILAHSSKTF